MTTSVAKQKKSVSFRILRTFLVLAILITITEATVVLLHAWRASKHDIQTLSGPTMGTTYSIKCWGQTPTPVEGLQDRVDALLLKINEQMSTYLPDSELSRFNKATAGEWFPVSKETAFVTAEAIRFYELTEGASDVTVGPLVRLWNFGPSRGQIGSVVDAPASELLEKTRSQTGAKYLEARRDPPALRKHIEGLEVDLSSIAKGYAVDAVVELLRQEGLENFMVEIGGEVRAGGERRDGKPWLIGVERPDPKQRTLHEKLRLQNQAMATSGDYRNFREVEGERVSHIINPQTGRPLPYRGWSVTLLCNTCLEADALATALLVMGEQRGYDWCQKNNVAAMFLIQSSSDKVGSEIEQKMTPRYLETTALR